MLGEIDELIINFPSLWRLNDSIKLSTSQIDSTRVPQFPLEDYALSNFIYTYRITTIIRILYIYIFQFLNSKLSENLQCLL